MTNTYRINFTESDTLPPTSVNKWNAFIGKLMDPKNEHWPKAYDRWDSKNCNDGWGELSASNASAVAMHRHPIHGHEAHTQLTRVMEANGFRKDSRLGGFVVKEPGNVPAKVQMPC